MDILFLHGALGTKDQVKPFLPYFQNSDKVHSFNFEGHGGCSLSGELLIDNMLEQTLQYCDDNNLKEVSIFGYSLGGYVGTCLALKKPSLVQKLFTYGTRYQWNPDVASKETKLLVPEKIKIKVPHFASYLEKLHGKDWPILVEKTAALLKQLGQNDQLSLEKLNNISCPFRVAVGDRDSIVSLVKNYEVSKAVKNGSFLVLPKTEHPIEKVDHKSLGTFLNQFY
ncbi:MAG: alpha/beta fold hydrolase [Bacteriovoracaceae bacterium]